MTLSDTGHVDRSVDRMTLVGIILLLCLEFLGSTGRCQGGLSETLQRELSRISI
jgi:hypothetical protein